MKEKCSSINLLTTCLPDKLENNNTGNTKCIICNQPGCKLIICNECRNAIIFAKNIMNKLKGELKDEM